MVPLPVWACFTSPWWVALIPALMGLAGLGFTPILRPPLPKACPISALEDKSHLVFSTQLSSHFSGDPPENSGPPYSPGLSTVSPKDFITQFNTWHTLSCLEPCSGPSESEGVDSQGAFCPHHAQNNTRQGWVQTHNARKEPGKL